MPATNIYTLQDDCSPISLNDFKLLKKDLLCLLKCYITFFLIQIRGAGHQ